MKRTHLIPLTSAQNMTAKTINIACYSDYMVFFKTPSLTSSPPPNLALAPCCSKPSIASPTWVSSPKGSLVVSFAPLALPPLIIQDSVHSPFLTLGPPRYFKGGRLGGREVHCPGYQALRGSNLPPPSGSQGVLEGFWGVGRWPSCTLESCRSSPGNLRKDF